MTWDREPITTDRDNFHTSPCEFEDLYDESQYSPSMYAHHASIQLPTVVEQEIVDAGDISDHHLKTYLNLDPPMGDVDHIPSLKEFTHVDSDDNKDMLGWKLKHPEHWGTSEVLDWVYFVAKTYEWNGSLFRGESFNKLTGPALIRMNKNDFLKCDENYGDFLHQCFFKLLKEATFHRPELLGHDPSFNDISDLELDMTINTEYDYSDVKDGLQFPDPMPGQIKMYGEWSSTSERSRNSSLSSEDVNLHYPYATTHQHQPHQLQQHQPQQQQQQQQQQPYFYTAKTHDMNGLSAQPDSWSLPPQKPAKRPPGRPRKIRPPGEEGKPYTPSQRGRKPGQTAKGNHLWEFIRDLLKDPEANPKLIRWEEPYNLGIFRIMESDTVAKMWGKKKNNPKMDYPKLSRAIRFCRTAGYFMGVPKDGRYPKKLCFRFGDKAFGWQDLQKHCPPQHAVMTS